MINIIIYILLLIIAAISNAIMDIIQFKYYESIFSKLKNDKWWNPEISWKNKWKNGDVEQGPKFFGSTTFLVFITDAWHFFQKILWGSLFLIISLLSYNYFNLEWLYIIVIWIGLHVIFGGVFELFWSKILKK